MKLPQPLKNKLSGKLTMPALFTALLALISGVVYGLMNLTSLSGNPSNTPGEKCSLTKKVAPNQPPHQPFMCDGACGMG